MVCGHISYVRVEKRCFGASIHRTLNITCKSAWLICHRIWDATRDKIIAKLTGTVPADETYMGTRTLRGHKVHDQMIQDEIEMDLRPRPARKSPYQDKTTVYGMIERGGVARTMVVPESRGNTLRPIMTNMIDLQKARLITDRHASYRHIKEYLPHDIIDHEIEYVRCDIHTQGIENYWSILNWASTEYSTM